MAMKKTNNIIMIKRQKQSNFQIPATAPQSPFQRPPTKVVIPVAALFVASSIELSFFDDSFSYNIF
jgi:hypothetical protein